MSRSKRQGEGYLLIDHRNSPGVPAEMAHATGLPVSLSGPGGVFESATKMCAHCNAIVVLNPDRKRPRGYCAKCDAYVCDNPACGLECRPFKRLIDELK